MWIRFLFAFAASLWLGAFSVEAMAAHAFASAEKADDMIVYWVVDEPSKARAEKEIMAMCKQRAKKNGHRSPCKLLGAADGPMYLAIFHTIDGAGVGVASHSDRQTAIDNAYTFCTQRGACPSEARTVAFDAGQGGQQPASVKNPQQAKNCQPPAGKVLRYHDNCFNGDCTRTFENGCTRRFQAPYCFDPVQQKWEWKPDGC